MVPSAAETKVAPCVFCGRGTQVYDESPHVPGEAGWEPTRLHVDFDAAGCGSTAGRLQDVAVATTVDELGATRRQIAIEHVKALTGVTKNVAANHVDGWDFTGLPIPEEEVLTVVRSAVAGRSTPTAVGLALRSLGVDVDLHDDVLFFGVAGIDWFSWSPGTRPVVTLRGGRMVASAGSEDVTGERLDIEVTEANPLRTAKALRRLLG